MTAPATISLSFSQITPQLYISALPRNEHAEHLLSLGVRLIISMPLQLPGREFRGPPFEWLYLPTIDSPLTPMPIFMLRRGVQRALEVIAAGDGVLVHCKQGVHRSVAMACCILIGLGYSSEGAMALVKAQRAVADPDVPYIRSRILKFERSWRPAPES